MSLRSYTLAWRYCKIRSVKLHWAAFVQNIGKEGNQIWLSFLWKQSFLCFLLAWAILHTILYFKQLPCLVTYAQLEAAPVPKRIWSIGHWCVSDHGNGFAFILSQPVSLHMMLICREHCLAQSNMFSKILFHSLMTFSCKLLCLRSTRSHLQSSFWVQLILSRLPSHRQTLLFLAQQHPSLIHRKWCKQQYGIHESCMQDHGSPTHIHVLQC